MRKCEKCNIDYPDDQFYCTRCGIPTEDSSVGEALNIMDIEFKQVEYIDPLTKVLLWTTWIVFSSLAVILLFSSPLIFNIIAAVVSFSFVFVSFRNYKQGRVEKPILKMNALSKIVITIWIPIFTIFWVTASYLGGGPAGETQVSNCEYCVQGNYYLVNAGRFTEVDFTTFQFMGNFETFIMIHFIVSGTLILISLIISWIRNRR